MSADGMVRNDEPALNIDQEVDLLEYLNAILRVKYRVLIAGIFVAGIVFGASKLVENKYAAVAVLAVNLPQSFGGVKPGQYRGSDVVGLLEYSFMLNEPADNEQDRMIARLNSTHFIELFIRENDLLKYIFRDKWDPLSESWEEGFEPSMAQAAGYFRTDMLGAVLDEKSGLLPIVIKSADPILSADLANKYYQRFNQYIRERRLAELSKQAEILNGRLDETSNLDMQRSIYRMLETQLAEEIMLNAKDDYPLELIQRAQPPLFKTSPNRKVWTILAFVLTVILGVVFTIGLIILKKLRSALSEYGFGSSKDVKPSKGQKNSRESADQKSEEPVLVTQEDPDRKASSKPEKDPLADSLDEWID